jgi:ADP-ribosylglycohydrolase
MVSDDTDHTVFVAQSIHLARGNARIFSKALATRLRLWFATLPAGIGLATLRSILLLCIGVPPDRSGVRSSGNGPSMRSAIVGCYFSADAAKRREFIEASTFITHRDPIALAGAMAIAEVAAKLTNGEWPGKPSISAFEECLRGASNEILWQQSVDEIIETCATNSPVDVAANHFGKNGISGYTLHAVPFALVAWYVHFGDFRATMETIVRAGGDTDTIGAIAGALSGITVGRAGIPAEWVTNIVDWPHSVAYLVVLAELLSGEAIDTNVGFRFGLFLRSPLFTAIILSHGLRRCLPPY